MTETSIFLGKNIYSWHATGESSGTVQMQGQGLQQCEYQKMGSVIKGI